MCDWVFSDYVPKQKAGFVLAYTLMYMLCMLLFCLTDV